MLREKFLLHYIGTDSVNKLVFCSFRNKRGKVVKRLIKEIDIRCNNALLTGVIIFLEVLSSSIGYLSYIKCASNFTYISYNVSCVLSVNFTQINAF